MRAAPILMYGASMLANFTGFWWREDIAMTSLDGHVWSSRDMFGSMILVSLWTILPITAYAFYRLQKDFK